MSVRTPAILLWLLLVASAGFARDIYVDVQVGNDAANGLASTPGATDGPVKTIARAVKLAAAGDVVHLGPAGARLKESVELANRSGEPDRPLVIDGHGVTLDGSEPIRPEDWTMVAPGLFKNDHLVKDPASVIQRFFFVFDDRMVHMGRTSKGSKAPWKKPEELAAGEWTFVESDKTFYVKIDSANDLASARIATPVRSNGVAIHGKCEHLIVRNMIATRVLNDGYNIHGYTRDVLFHNVQAIECGDDGLSAHGQCAVAVDGFYARGNSTGMCNVDNSSSACRRVFIENNLGIDYYMLGTNRHSLVDSVILSSRSRSVAAMGGKEEGDILNMTFANVLAVCTGARGFADINRKTAVEFDRTTFQGFDFRSLGKSCHLRNSVIAGSPPVRMEIGPEVDWKSSNNVYDLHSLQFGSHRYLPPDFGAYQSATGQDLASTWTKVLISSGFLGVVESPVLPAGVGVDAKSLPTRPGN